MKAVGLAVLAVLTVLGVMALADLTQNRPDPVVDDSSTTIDLRRRPPATTRGSEVMAAQSLWAVCQATIGGENTAATEAGDTSA